MSYFNLSRCDLSKYYTSSTFLEIQVDIGQLTTAFTNLVWRYIHSGYTRFIFQKPGQVLTGIQSRFEMMLWWKKIHSLLMACAISVQKGFITAKQKGYSER